MRVDKLRNILDQNDHYPYIVFDRTNIKYLTGFTGSNAFVVLTPEKNYFISDSRYEIYAKSILNENWNFVLQETDFFSTIEKLLDKGRIYLEPHKVTLSVYKRLETLFGNESVRESGSYINDLRSEKDEEEISTIRQAVKIADDCFEHLLKYIKPGLTEWDLAVEIDYFYKRNGCRGVSFDSIVASGAGSAMPHYEPSNKLIEDNNMLMIDMGCIYNEYCSDMTRTVFIGSVPEKFKDIYSIVLEAQEKACQSVKAGITAGELDSVAREHILNAGYGNEFGHSLGHGVGLDVHENPYVKNGSNSVIPENSLITIEPGIYIEGEGGVRIEDIVLVKKEGYEILTSSTKELIII